MPEITHLSVLPTWISGLPLQQQSVLVLALRGPDGQPKHTTFKPLLRAYRGTILRAARYGRFLEFGEKADSFMSLDEFAYIDIWAKRVHDFLHDEADGANLHSYTHFMHGVEILGYKHPEPRHRERWLPTYIDFVHRLHLNVETEEQMDNRLSDWNRTEWVS